MQGQILLSSFDEDTTATSAAEMDLPPAALATFDFSLLAMSSPAPKTAPRTTIPATTAMIPMMRFVFASEDSAV